MKPTYYSSSIVHAPAKARYVRTSDRKRHAITIRYVDPRPPLDAETIRANVWKNDGLRAHSDIVARLHS